MAHQDRGGTLYQIRLAKEQAISDEVITARMRWDKPILSQNSKCGISLDLPISYCRPTRACAEVCYACQGTQNFYRSVVKSLAVSRMIDEDPNRAARKIIDESQGRTVRIAGSGEILPKHKALLDLVTKYGGSWWGFTKRVETHRALPQLMFSFDATTHSDVLNYIHDEVPVNRRAYMMRPGDTCPPIDVAVTFPVHGTRTRYANVVEESDTDCPAVRKQINGCWDCKRCM